MCNFHICNSCRNKYIGNNKYLWRLLNGVVTNNGLVVDFINDTF